MAENAGDSKGTTNPEHLKGFYLIFVAIITLVGGYVFKDPINNALQKKYSHLGGVWKSHQDLESYCEIYTIGDTFYVRINVALENKDWIIYGHGKTDGISGDVIGTRLTKLASGSVSNDSVWLHVEVAGTDQLGVTMFLDAKHQFEPRVFAFIRETPNSMEINNKDKKVTKSQGS